MIGTFGNSLFLAAVIHQFKHRIFPNVEHAGARSQVARTAEESAREPKSDGDCPKLKGEWYSLDNVRWRPGVGVDGCKKIQGM